MATVHAKFSVLVVDVVVTTVAEHFLSSPHNISKDMQLIPIEKIFSNRDSIRKAREAFLISKGRTIDPNGLNISEETYQISVYYLDSSLLFFRYS